MVRNFCCGACFFILFISCNQASHDIAIEQKGTPVKITRVVKKFMNDTLTLYGTLQFLNKTAITSPITGFIQSVNAATGDVPDLGKSLFTIQTKEAAAYPKQIADTLFKHSLISVKASHHFQIDSVLKQMGDFVQEGEVLCETVDPLSMVVQLNFPFEKNRLVKAGTRCEVLFPGGKNFSAQVSKILPEVDAASQTQLAYVHMNGVGVFPEHLNVTVKFSEAASSSSSVLPKDAVLTDETMSTYWVMKLINDSTAVKQKVSIGKKTPDEIEITQPLFNADDRILYSGNYGLPDTAKVTLIK